MESTIKKTILLLFILSYSLGLWSQNKYIYVHSENVSVQNKRKVTLTQDIYYQAPSNKIAIKYTAPEEYIYQSNIKGEAHFYYPKTNEVQLIHDLFLSSKNNVLYYFANNRISNMGLEEGGFVLNGSENKDNLIISKWKAPINMQKYIASAELVHENYLPKYMAYYSAKGNIVKKIFYLNYQNQGQFTLPMRIIEIEYKSPTDSIIRSQTFSKIKTQAQAFNPMFNFQIPKNAKTIN